MLHADICIAGAGVIGLSLALELQARNLKVLVLETGQPLRQASVAAAGMLAAQDPHNPVELLPLSRLSISLYPRFLDRLEELSGIAVPFQTSGTLQAQNMNGEMTSAIHDFDAFLTNSDNSGSQLPSGFHLIHEHSLDPRNFASALLAAVQATSIDVMSGAPVLSTSSTASSALVATSNDTVAAEHFIDCTGAWVKDDAYRVIPIKGQMLSVALPSRFPLKKVVRTSEIYIVPRTVGADAGRAIIGATVEDAGFDKTVNAWQVEELYQKAVALLPRLTSARILEAWAGLRPATVDRLPILGAHPTVPHHWVASGHYRNGILLAPATARVMAQSVLGETPSASLREFEPSRFSVLHASGDRHDEPHE